MNKLAITTFLISASLTLAHPVAHFYQTAEDSLKSKASALYANALGSLGLQVTPSDDIDTLLDAAASRYNLNPHILHAMAITESHKNPAALSPKGAIGLLQVMPANAHRCGLPYPQKLWDIAANVNCGALIISQELTQHPNLSEALKVYNGGPGALKHTYPESDRYAMKVLSELGARIGTTIQ